MTLLVPHSFHGGIAIWGTFLLVLMLQMAVVDVEVLVAA
jgi:hypothetical protein